MPFVIIKASEVREGEPRWWVDDRETAMRDVNCIAASDLHTRPDREPLAPFAIVDRPEQPATPTPDPREEAFWSAAFCASLSALDHQRSDDHLAAQAGGTADAALAEWRKRWGAK